MVSFFQKVLTSKAADIQRAEANRLAELLADQKIQQERAEKRLRGVREGGRRPQQRRSGASIDDLMNEFVAGREGE